MLPFASASPVVILAVPSLLLLALPKLAATADRGRPPLVRARWLLVAVLNESFPTARLLPVRAVPTRD